MLLGGRAAESLVFSRVTTGAQNDLERVTGMAKNQIAVYGMNSAIGNLSYDLRQPGEGKKTYLRACVRACSMGLPLCREHQSSSGAQGTRTRLRDCDGRFQPSRPLDEV